MKNIQNAAFVVSIHYGNTNEGVRINVKWKGNHEISDFNFVRFGEVLSSESETENTGWVVVRSSYRMNNSGVAPFQQTGPAILRLSEGISSGEKIPLL
jgi:hypothetical protein